MDDTPIFDQEIIPTIQVIGIGRRFVAYIIDSFILALLWICVATLIGPYMGAETEGFSIIALLPQCIFFLSSVAYFIIFWSTASGQTPGKMALGIKIISTAGQPPTFGQAILRYIGYMISGFIMNLGFLWIAIDDQRQGWHDKVAKTYVVPKDTHFTNPETIEFVPSDTKEAGLIIAALLLIGPIICLILMFLSLIFFASSSGVAPFIYTLF